MRVSNVLLIYSSSWVEEYMDVLYTLFFFLNLKGFPDSSVRKESPYNAGDPGSIPGWEDLLEKG